VLFCCKIKLKIPLYFGIKSRIFSRPRRISSLSRTIVGASISQSVMYFRVVQVTKSLQDPLEVGNNLPGISDNVPERGVEQKCFQTPTEGRQRRGRCHVVRQAVPDGGSVDREGPAADGRQLHGRYQQTIGPSRASLLVTVRVHLRLQCSAQSVSVERRGTRRTQVRVARQLWVGRSPCMPTGLGSPFCRGKSGPPALCR